MLRTGLFNILENLNFVTREALPTLFFVLSRSFFILITMVHLTCTLALVVKDVVKPVCWSTNLAASFSDVQFTCAL